MKIALASPPVPSSVNDGLLWLERLSKEAAAQQAKIVCFPESYIPGYPLAEYAVEEASAEKLQSALNQACTIASENKIAIILPMDWYTPKGLLNIAHVISGTGELLGYQSKNQLDPTEDARWIPGTTRNIFEADGLKFGITICHEGFRYPESVRWAARRGAKVVFHPHFAGSDRTGILPTQWGSMDNPYYEKAMMMRALENTIYFASANYAFRYPESASSVLGPDGGCIGYQPYGKPGVLVTEIDPLLATGLLAERFKPLLVKD
ncbi:carbon-nitrogen hydrolase family protein [Hufsiella ginkgonis]|uniref:Carbon-nitrogen hydrolase family protein n=1 Tax=Hufsiella ginkgonis TaxID=2695274 RepID=A0A7K1Y246_9SPHI|nr:carbon-nitrogen hydrolase family protein [Hufsiella ginkgonis]MXV17262.1 carbon-nitrogen hydrolase family protein [Hufsiella ginkgonis]